MLRDRASLLGLLCAGAGRADTRLTSWTPKPVFDQRTNEPIIAIKMTSASAKLFAELTSQNIGRRLELRIDGKTVMAPVIREPVMGGSVQVSGSWTLREVRDLADTHGAVQGHDRGRTRQRVTRHGAVWACLAAICVCCPGRCDWLYLGHVERF